jgi:light-regulated signal transduction histidine kinase (bacteriophytochrome)
MGALCFGYGMVRKPDPARQEPGGAAGALGHPARVRARANQMAQLIDDLAPEQAGRQIRFTVGDFPVCMADRALLRQVFANLIGNAVKYTRDRPVAEIEIGSAVHEGESRLFVRDNGVGFQMEDAGKPFGVFQRLHADSDFEGTGICLAIVQRIVQRHGGRVWAESAPDRGATFYLTLPAAA